MANSALKGFGPVRWTELTLSLDTGGAYADGDVLAAPQEIAEVFGPTVQTAVLQSLHVLDEDDQAQALDVVFLNANGSLGTENAAAGPTDAVARTITGIVSVVAADYVDLGNSQLAIPAFNPFVLASAFEGATSCWVGAISRGTGTYTASGIRLRLGLIV